MALATVGLDGAAMARMVVLRDVREESRRLEFHTDARSPKVAQLSAEPRATLLFWDPAARLQLRAEGRVVLFGAGTPEAEERFERLSEAAKRTYQTDPAAGTPLHGSETAPIRTEGAGDLARSVFTVAWLTVERIDWLQLSDEGQRRAEIVYEGEGATQRWIAP